MIDYFEQAVLIDEASQHTIIERRYASGRIEYWSVINVTLNGGPMRGTAQVPFKIDVGSRQEAFEKFDDAFKAAEPQAKADIIARAQQEYDQHQKKEQAKIVLANALPPIPVR